MAKTKTCKHCGAEIAKSAKVCPHCGGKNKKPFIVRLLIGILIVVGAFMIIDALLSDPDYVAPEDREYIEVTADEMYDELYENAMNAEEKYNDAYVAITGRLSTIDSDGSYISIAPDNHPLDSVMCYITNDDQKEKIKSMSKGETITVKGQIRDVGEVMGYSMNIDSIE